MVLCRKWFFIGFEGDLCEGIGLYGAQEALGKAISPKLHHKNIFRIFPDVGTSSGARLALHGACLLPLCGPMGLFVCLGSPLLSFFRMPSSAILARVRIGARTRLY